MPPEESVPDQSATINDSQLTNNGSPSNGDGDILLFGYNGDLTIENVDINSSTGGRAIQMRGSFFIANTKR